MKNFTLKKMTNGICLLAGIGMLAATQPVNAQSPMVRTYADFQGSLLSGTALATSHLVGSIANAANAVDGNPADSSTLAVPISLLGLVSTTQFLEFTTDGTNAGARTIAAGTPVTVKLSLPQSLIGLVDGVTVGSFTDLHTVSDNWPVILGVGGNYHDAGYDATKTAIYSSTTLANVLNGRGVVEVTVTPSTAYNGVYVELEGNGVSLALNASVYHAYIEEAATSSVVCSDPIDVLYGIRAGAASLATASGNVSNPWNAVDQDATTYAEINVGAQLLSEAFVTGIFRTTAKAGDSVTVLLQDPGGLLNVTALTGFAVNLYDGNTSTPVQTVLNTSALLDVNIFDPVSNIYALTFAATADFDRAEIKMGGVASAFNDLRIYEISTKMAAPTMTAAQKEQYVYAGQSATLGATTTNGDDIVWYDDSTGGTLVPSNTVTTTTAQAGTTLHYYAAAERNGCSDASYRNEAQIHVIGFSTATPGDGDLNVTYNGSVAVTPTSGTLPSTPTYTYSVASGALPNGINLDGATGDLSGTPTQTGTYTFGILVHDDVNNIPVGTFSYTITINNTPLAVTWGDFSAHANADHTVSLSWQTLSEQNNSYFAVERATDGKHFNEIGRVKSHAGQSVNNYSFLDKNATQPTLYYRLRQVDIDGKYTFSTIQKVDFGTDAGNIIKIAPNPGHDYINVHLTSVDHAAQIVVMDVTGRIVYQSEVTGTALNIPAAAGTYFVNVLDASGKLTASQKAIIK